MDNMSDGLFTSQSADATLKRRRTTKATELQVNTKSQFFNKPNKDEEEVDQSNDSHVSEKRVQPGI